MVFVHSCISNFSCHNLPNLWGSFQAHKLQLISMTLLSSLDFFLRQDPSTCLLLFLNLTLLQFDFYSVVGRDSKVHGYASSFFLFTITGSDLLVGIRLFYSYLTTLENLMRRILQDRFWFVHIPFGSTVKFKFLAQFPVDHPAHPIMSSLIIFLHTFTAFTYVIDRFVSITTWPTLAIILCLINLRFNKVVLLLVEIMFVSSTFLFLAMSRSFRAIFLPFQLPSYCRSLEFYVALLFLVAVISLSLLFFYEVFEYSSWCIDAILKADESSSSFFSWPIDSLYFISQMYCFTHYH